MVPFTISWSGFCNLVMYQWVVFVAFVLVEMCFMVFWLLHTKIGEDNRTILLHEEDGERNRRMEWFFSNDDRMIHQGFAKKFFWPTYQHTGRRYHTLPIDWFVAADGSNHLHNQLSEYDPISSTVTRPLISIWLTRLKRIAERKPTHQSSAISGSHPIRPTSSRKK